MKKVGVIVGRFQVPELHAGHRYLVETAIKQCDHVLVVLGHTETLSERNPFSKKARHAMLKASYPKIQLAAINDELSDEQWSEKLDQIIVKRFPDTDVTLYGSRDSFLAAYTETRCPLFIFERQATNLNALARDRAETGNRLHPVADYQEPTGL